MYGACAPRGLREDAHSASVRPWALQISQWEPTTTAALPSGVGHSHSDKSDWSNSKVLLTEFCEEEKAFEALSKQFL